MPKVHEERGMQVIINRDEQPMRVHCIRGNETVIINLIGTKALEWRVTSATTVTLALKLVEDNYLKLFNEWHKYNP